MSLIKMRNNNGPKIDPCGTPLITYNQDDTLPFRTTLCCLPFNHSPIHCNNYFTRYPVYLSLTTSQDDEYLLLSTLHCQSAAVDSFTPECDRSVCLSVCLPVCHTVDCQNEWTCHHRLLTPSHSSFHASGDGVKYRCGVQECLWPLKVPLRVHENMPFQEIFF